MRLFLLLLLLLNASISAIELSVPPLKPQRVVIDSISKFNNDVVVRGEKWDKKREAWKQRLWKLNFNKKTIEPYFDKNKKEIIAIFQNKKTLQVYATRKGNAVFLKFLNDSSRNKVVRVKANEAFKIVANNRFIYLLFKDKILLITKKKVKEIKLSTLDVLSRNTLPVSIAIDEANLFIGYNWGEWGGSLYQLSIGSDGNFTKNKYLLGKNIDTLKLDENKILWITTSLSHLISISSGLYKYVNNELTTLIEQKGTTIRKNPNFKSKGKITLKNLTAINGMTLTKDGNIILVAPSIGLLSINKSYNLRYLWRGKLSLRYYESEHRMTNSKKSVVKVNVGSSPEGVVILNQKFFVANRSLGVLEYIKVKGGHYVPASQYTFQ